MQHSKSCDRLWSNSLVGKKIPKSIQHLTDSYSILFLACACISGFDSYKFWKSGTERKQPEIYGQTPSRACSPEGKDEEWSADTDDLEAKYDTDTYMGWAQEHQPTFAESDTREGRHPGRQVSYASTKTIPYERDLTPSAMSPTTVEDRYTGIFPPSRASYSFSRE